MPRTTFVRSGIVVWVAGAVVITSVLWSPARGLRAEPADVVINEILYHPDPDNAGGEFVEVLNRGGDAVDLSGWEIVDAVRFEFPAGTLLEPGQFLVVARNLEDATAFYGVENLVGDFDGRLDNAGDEVILRDAAERVIDIVPYDDEVPWPLDADGGGPSLELIDPFSDNSQAENWRPGHSYSPGGRNSPRASGQSDIVITEIMYKPLRQELRQKFDPVNGGPYIETDEDDFGEYVEILNLGDATVDVSAWRFSEGVEYVFPDGTALKSGGHFVVAASPEIVKLRTGFENVFGPFARRLRNRGERVTLRDHDGLLVDTVRYADGHPWPTSPDEFGVSLECVDPSVDNASATNWRASEVKFLPPELIFPPEDRIEQGWQFVSVTGTARDSELLIYIPGPGEWLIDEVELRRVDDGPNLVINGAFDHGDDGWEKLLNHSESFWTDEDAKEGNGSEHIVSTGRGFASQSLRTVIKGVEEGRSYTLSAWVKELSGHPYLIVRLGGTELEVVAGALSTGFDVAEEWSDTDNPNLTWSYRQHNGSLFRSQTSNWQAASLGPAQPAWARGEAETPGWCQSTGNAPGVDFPEGWIGTHGPAQLRWTSPGLGKLTISGGLYLLRPDAGDQAWEIQVDGETVTSGELLSRRTEFGSSAPLSFASGTGGAQALTMNIDQRERVTLLIQAKPDQMDDFVAVDLSLNFRPGTQRDPPVHGAFGGGTPGQPNSVSAEGIAPLVEDLKHVPALPTSADAVTVTAKVISPGELASVQLGLEFLHDATREVAESLEMFDDGRHGDRDAGDGVFGVVVTARASQTLVHYWVRAEDTAGRVTHFPYDGEPSPTQAYFHFDDEIDTQLTTYHVFMDPETIVELNRNSKSGEYFDCSLVIDDRRPGKEAGPVAYPHIGARHRGRRSRTDPRHQWKFKFNRIQLYDGQRVLDTMLSIPLIQRMAFRIFDHVGIDNIEADLVRLHLNGEFWAMYIVFEVPNSTWLEKHGHDTSTEVYKARTVETTAQAKNSDLFTNRLETDLDFWGAWNKKIRSLESPEEIRELTEKLNGLTDEALRPWLDANVDIEQWFTRWGVNLLLNIDDFCGHNYYLFRSGDAGGKWKMFGYDFDSLGRLIAGNLGITYGDGRTGSPAWQRNKLYERVASDPSLRRIHVLNLRRLLKTFFTEEALFPLIDEEFARTAAERALGTNLRDDADVHLKNQITTQRQRFLEMIDDENLPGEAQVPGFDPSGGVFGEPVMLRLSAPEGWQVVYTTDGSDPRLSTTSVLYTEPIALGAPTVVRAASIASETVPPNLASGNWTDLGEERYDIELDSPHFIRGDFNLDGRVNLTDAVQVLLHVFKGAPAVCRIAGDSDNDDSLDVADAIYLLRYLFVRGPSPSEPFPKPGVDLDGASSLGCEQGLAPREG